MQRKILKGIIYAGLFIVPFIPLFVSSSLFFPFITTKAFTWRIIVEIVSAAWLLLAYLDPVYRPKKSIILWSMVAFLVVIGLADLFGAAPVKSFWSNFERMEGFVTLLHLGAFFIVLGSFFKEREWKWWWNTSLGVSVLICIYSFMQLGGGLAIHQGGARVDASFGNAAYLAVYMLVNIFLALFLMVREKEMWKKWTYGILIFLQLIVLYYTATRGSILGLLGGLILVGLLNITNKESQKVRKMSIAGLVVAGVIVGGFFAIRSTSFVKNSPVLGRFSSISAAELKTEGRSFIWPMALQGIKEHPLLGWGQDNFNYVFDEHYSPEMFNLEPWFDRAHNIFLDWGVAGGLLGLLAYLSFYVTLLLSIWKKDATLTRLDRSILTGLIAGYFFHNLFVFDNLMSYILFIAILAYVHSHTTAAPSTVQAKVTEEREAMTGYFAVPAALVLVAILYLVNIKPIITNQELIRGLQAIQTPGANPSDILTHFQKAYNESRLGRPEVVEWISSSADTVLASTVATTEEKNTFFAFAKSAIEKQVADVPTDARYQLLAGSFFSRNGQFVEAGPYLADALKLMPGKQAIYFEQGGLLLSQKDYKGAEAVFKQAYDLAPEYKEAQMVYLVGAIYAGDNTKAKELIGTIPAQDIVSDNRVTGALYATGQFGDLIMILQTRLNNDKTNPQNYADLALAFAKAGQKTNAIAVLQALEKALPQYKTEVDQYIENVKSGNI